MKHSQSKSCKDFPGRRYSGSGSTHLRGHTSQTHEPNVPRGSFNARRALCPGGGVCVPSDKTSNSADAVSSDREHTNRRSVPLCPLARTALPSSLSLSAAFPLPFYCLTARFCRFSYLHRLPKQGPPTSRHNLSTLCIVVCLTPLPPFAVHHPCQLSNPFQVRLHSHQHSHKTMVEYAVERLQKKNVHKIFN